MFSHFVKKLTDLDHFKLMSQSEKSVPFWSIPSTAL